MDFGFSSFYVVFFLVTGEESSEERVGDTDEMR